MKFVLNIILSFLLFSSLYAEKRIENIKITNNGYFQIYIYLTETGTYDVKTKDNICKLYLKDYILSQNFPGSDFYVESSFLKRVFLTKSDSSGIIFNFELGNGSECIVQNYEKSAIISISVYSNELINETDKLFFKGLKLEIEGEKEKALLEYRKLLSEKPNHANALFHAGLLRKTLGYNYQSKSNFQLSKKNGNLNSELVFQLADTYSLLGDENNSKEEMKKYQELLDKERSDKYDSTCAVVVSRDLASLKNDDEFVDEKNDSTVAIARIKTPERKIIKTIPVNSNAYYYSLAANIFIVLIAVGSVIYIWRLLKNRRRKQNESLKKKKIKIDLREDLTPEQKPDPAFHKLVSAYTNDVSVLPQVKQMKEPVKKEKIYFDDNDNSVIKNNYQESDIDRLARKYQVERGKIELALKIIAKNDTESAKDKYLLLMKMLKENMSLEELASDLRIPRGELELVMNLKNI